MECKQSITRKYDWDESQVPIFIQPLLWLVKIIRRYSKCLRFSRNSNCYDFVSFHHRTFVVSYDILKLRAVMQLSFHTFGCKRENVIILLEFCFWPLIANCCIFDFFYIETVFIHILISFMPIFDSGTLMGLEVTST